MKLIIGLGNPGQEYKKTRHNMGFEAIDKIVSNLNLDKDSFKQKFNGLYLKTIIENEIIMFLKPQSYMNLSGEVVKKYIDYFDIKIEDILVVFDDLDLPVGKIRLKAKGSSGGHNGIKNIIQHIGTQDFKRLKIGIGNDKLTETKNYVLGKFSKSEEIEIKKAIEMAATIAIEFINNDFEMLMSKYN